MRCVSGYVSGCNGAMHHPIHPPSLSVFPLPAKAGEGIGGLVTFALVGAKVAGTCTTIKHAIKKCSIWLKICVRLCQAKSPMCTPLRSLGVQNRFLHQLLDRNQNHALDLFYTIGCRKKVSVTPHLPPIFLIISPLSLIPCHATFLFLNANVQCSPYQSLLLSLMNNDKKPFVSKKNHLCFHQNTSHNTQMTRRRQKADTNDTQMAKWQSQMTHRWQNGRHK